MPKISIIVPVYNVESVLQYCVDGILNQSFVDYEIVLIDDGSSDNSGGICDHYAKTDPRVKTIHTANCGVSSARNTGLKTAIGEYICFIDSDDYVNPNYLSNLIDSKNLFQDYDNIWCGFQTVKGYSASTPIKTVLFSETEDISFLKVRQIMDLHQKWLSAGPVCKLYSHQIILDNNLSFDETLSLGEDLIFNLQYLDCTNGKIVVNNQCLYNYVISQDDTLSKKYYSDMFEIYKTINNAMLKYITKWNCDEKQFEIYYNACFHKYEVVLRNTFHVNSNISHKYRYNKVILESNEFKTALENAKCFIHPVYRFAYEHSLPVLLRLLDSYSLKQ